MRPNTYLEHPSRLLSIFLAAAFLTAACGGGGGREDPDAAGNNNSNQGDGGLPCTGNCAIEGEATCDATGTGRWVCTEIQPQCLVSIHEDCAPGTQCSSGLCVPCTGESGTFHDQVFPFESEDRFYYLYVPDSYVCADPRPLLVDLHGSAVAPRPEEAYGLNGARATADASGHILLRPRSRSSLEGNVEVHRWDQNPGDPERNRRFINALVDDLGQRYHLDPERRYLMGFSSGTNQTSVALADPESPFTGFGFVGGGAWTVTSLEHRPGRLYFNTGFRDYMRTFHDQLLDLLDQAGFTGNDFFTRETDAGHELYDWMYPELFGFLDQGLRPADGSLAAGWTLEPAVTGESLLALTLQSSGELLAVGAAGEMVRRDTNGTWSAVTVSGTPAFEGRDFTAACVTADGIGIAVGGGLLARSSDGGQTWSHRPALPEFGDPMLGFAYLNGVACGITNIVATGYWTGAASTDGGLTFSEVSFDAGDYRAQGAAIKVAPWSSWIAVGYWGYVARSADGMSYTTSLLSPHADWVYDVAWGTTDTWVAVGEAGHIWRSTDDGQTFTAVQTSGPDLYAVSFHDSQVGLAVGRRGAAFLTQDGGLTWTAVPTGLDRFNGDVRWLADGTAIVVGDAGLVLRFDPAGI